MQIYNKNPNYSINTSGEVYSHLTGIILKPGVDRYGYLIVTLCNNGKTKTTLVHRMVAETFIPNPENKPCVNHKDGDKGNCSVENLEWCTVKENAVHARDVLGYKPKQRPAQKYQKRARVRPTGEDHFSFKGYYLYDNKTFPTLTALAKYMGISKQYAHYLKKRGSFGFQPLP